MWWEDLGPGPDQAPSAHDLLHGVVLRARPSPTPSGGASVVIRDRPVGALPVGCGWVHAAGVLSGRGAGAGDVGSLGGGDWVSGARRRGAVLAVLCSVVALMLVGPAGWVALVALAFIGGLVHQATAPDRTGNVRYVTERADITMRVARALAGAPRRAALQPAAVAELSDDELCWWWRYSFTQLERADGAEALGRLVNQRRSYLDELDRRHPARFAAWISSGARANGDPARFLGPHRSP